jgi:hypothetical protein
MKTCNFITMPGGILRPADEDTGETVIKWGIGAYISGGFSRPRNAKFLRKFFALLDALFEQWEPQDTEYKGVQAQKSRERFREEITILAGYYDLVCSLKGEARVVAKSISFGKMDEDTFGELYNAVHKVGMDKILNSKGWTDDDLNSAVDRLMGFL